eukprot:2907387-Rhodomonas_salina.1
MLPNDAGQILQGVYKLLKTRADRQWFSRFEHLLHEYAPEATGGQPGLSGPAPAHTAAVLPPPLCVPWSKLRDPMMCCGTWHHSLRRLPEPRPAQAMRLTCTPRPLHWQVLKKMWSDFRREEETAQHDDAPSQTSAGGLGGGGGGGEGGGGGSWGQGSQGKLDKVTAGLLHSFVRKAGGYAKTADGYAWREGQTPQLGRPSGWQSDSGPGTPSRSSWGRAGEETGVRNVNEGSAGWSGGSGADEAASDKELWGAPLVAPGSATAWG